MSPAGEVTRLLRRLRGDGHAAVDDVLPRVYAELHRLAERQMRGERIDHTLGATGLVHEAYLKLASLDRIEWQNRSHFFAVAAQAMRRVLVDYAVARGAAKRGGGRRRVALEDADGIAAQRSRDVLELDEALDRLDAIDGRYSRVVECRFFAGLTIDETAEALGVSPASVKRDWLFARAWLHRELAR